ncbi:uncharacterized protein LOC125517050 [Triticum urartu]|uniref:uncharacterized protein LOC125517050 n=1 Tax=Triticum urartu TaxID=4572 RepID=UPI002043C305|nr:uncharacterized protein LOC125517050 [Triticum urartu]
MEGVQACNGDRLSELPADVLLNILERVGTLDAVRTCILSKQMQKLPAMLSQIVIDLSPRDLFQKSDVVADVTNKILSRRPPHITIRKLKLKFVLSPSRCLSIGKSVGLAMTAQKFDAAEFEIMTPVDFHLCTDAYHLLFAKQFNNFVHDCPDAFAGLTQLHLPNMRFGESDIPNILSNCKRLESLSFFMCGVGISSVLHVEHTQLVELVMSYCVFKTVELSSLPKLQRMTFGDWPCDETPLVLGFVPQLSKLSLANPNFSGKTHNLSKLLADAPTVNNLFLEFRSEKVLTLIISIPFLFGFNQNARKCLLMFSPNYDVKWEPFDPYLKHKNLARLTTYGFQSGDNFTRYVRRVIQAAVNVRKVSLHDRKMCKLCAEKFPHAEVRPSGYPRTSEEMDLSRKKMTAVSATACPDIHFCS